MNFYPQLWVKLLVLSLASVATQSTHGRRVSRDILRTALPDVTVVDDQSKNRLDEVVQNARNGSEVVITAKEVVLSKSIVLGKAITLKGDLAGGKPKIRCAPGEPAFSIQSVGVLLTNLEITGCNNSAVVINHGTSKDKIRTVFKGVDFIDNGQSGGVFPPGGGAINALGGAMVVIQACMFAKNSAQKGGAIFARASSLDISHSIFRENIARGGGGAISIQGSFFGQLPGEEGKSLETLKIASCIFEGNMAFENQQDLNGFFFQDGSPIEDAQFIQLFHPAPSGGAVYAAGLDLVTITACKFLENKGLAGGALFLTEIANSFIDDSMFMKNMLETGFGVGDAQFGVDSFSGFFETQVESIMHGGAIYAAYTFDASLQIKTCYFSLNKGAYGGALHVVGPQQSKIFVNDTSFEGNKASVSAGGIIIRNIKNPKLTHLRMINNSGQRGGGLLVTNGAGVSTTQGSIFSGNKAIEGGGIMCFGVGQVFIEDTTFSRNYAEKSGGGAAFVVSIARGRISFQGVAFTDNVAALGGAVFTDSIAQLDIRKSALFQNNRALSGGGILIRAQNLIQNQVNILETRFMGNRAGREACTEMERVNKTPQDCRKDIDDVLQNSCGLGGGGGACVVANMLPLNAPAKILFSGSNFLQNQGVNGGSLHIKLGGEDWKLSCPLVIPAFSRPCRSVEILRNTFDTSRAIFANREKDVYISDSTSGFGMLQSLADSRRGDPNAP